MDSFLLTALAFALVFWALAVCRFSTLRLKGAKSLRFENQDVLLLLFLASIVALFAMNISADLAGFLETDEDVKIFLDTIIVQCLAIGAAFIFSRMCSKPFSVFGRLELSHARLAFKYFFACAPFILLLGFEIASLWFAFTGEYPEPQEVIDVVGVLDGWRLALSLLSIIVLAPLSEELVFRKILYGICRGVMVSIGARMKWRIGISAVLTSLLFAFIHINAFAFLPLFFMGVFLALSYEKSGSIWTPIIFHSLFNGANIAMLFLCNEIV